MKENKNYIYWLVVIAGCGLIGTSLGLGVNVPGLYFSPIANDFGIGRGSVSATLTVYNLVQAFTGLIAPASLRRFGLRKLVIFGLGKRHFAQKTIPTKVFSVCLAEN